jgi:putative endonuclease
VTNNLQRRVLEHKSLSLPWFTQTYKVTKLVYFEEWNSPDDAIAREKQLKWWSRAKKDILIARMNPEMRDLYWDW